MPARKLIFIPMGWCDRFDMCVPAITCRGDRERDACKYYRHRVKGLGHEICLYRAKDYWIEKYFNKMRYGEDYYE